MSKKLLVWLILSLNVVLIANENITLQLHWKHQFQYAGFYAAVEKGYYDDVGINLAIKEWHPNINRIEELRDKKVDFIISASDKLGDIFRYKDLLIVSGYLQKTPLALAVKQDIYFPNELKDKKIMAIKEDIESSTFFKMWQTAQLNPKELNIVPHTFNMNSFIDGKVDAIQVYVTDQLFELASKKIKFNIIDANSYGVDFYDLMTITTKEFAQTNPKLVKSFKEATKKGWEYALKNKKEMINIIKSKYNSQNKSIEALLYEANRLENFILPDVYELGSLDKNKLRKIALVHLEKGNIQKINNIEDYIFSYKNFDKSLNLNLEEKNYLQKKEVLKICTLPNKIEIENETFYKSIDVRIIENITEKLNLKPLFIETKTYEQSLRYTQNGTCDILSIARNTTENNKLLHLSKPFVAQPLVMVSNKNILFIDNFLKIKNKTIGVVKDYSEIKVLQKMYPNLKIIEVESPEEGLKLVKKELIFGFVDIPIIISHHIKQSGFLDLKIVGSLNVNSGLSMAVTKEEVAIVPILEKAMNTISEDYLNSLINEWYAIKYEKGIDYTLVWKVLIFFVLLVITILYWANKLHLANMLLEEAQKALQKNNEELKRISITDRLTQIFNRHKLDKVLRDEKERCDRYDDSFGVILLDIDHFKSVNDTYGHQVGDVVLVEIANILKSNIRKTDILGRWGGEEFLIICIKSDLENTQKVAEKCRKAIENFNFTTINHKTASFGVSVYKKGNTIKETIVRADDNLYKAKESGRNKVIVS